MNANHKKQEEDVLCIDLFLFVTQLCGGWIGRGLDFTFGRIRDDLFLEKKEVSQPHITYHQHHNNITELRDTSTAQQQHTSSFLRLPICASKPFLIAATERVDPHASQHKKYKRFSFFSIVSGLLHVRQATYSATCRC